MLSGVLCCKQLVRRLLLQIMHIVLSPQSPLSVWPAWHKQCHISDRRVLSRITRGRKGRRKGGGGNGVRRAVWGADRRKVRQPIPYPQTGRCPLSLRGRLLTRGEPGGCWNEETWELLRGQAGHLMSSTRAECDAEWAEGERGSLCSLLQRPILTTKAEENLKQKPPSYLIGVVRKK